MRQNLMKDWPESQEKAAHTAIDTMIFNKSHVIDRICPACLRLYRVGEGPQAYSSLERFLERPYGYESLDEGKVREEQQYSGICSTICFEVMVEEACGKLRLSHLLGYVIWLSGADKTF